MANRRRQHGLGLLVLLLAALAAPSDGRAQGRSPWLELGLGGGGFTGTGGDSGAGGLAVHADVGWGLGRIYVSARATAIADSLGCCGPSAGDRSELGLLLGVQRVGRSSVLTFGAGPSSANGSGFGEGAWGLGLEARLLQQRGLAGVGLYMFANLNSRSSWFGLDVALRFGGR